MIPFVDFYCFFWFVSVIDQVINETVRLANIVPGIFRKVVKDVEIKGKFNILNMKFNIYLNCQFFFSLKSRAERVYLRS